MYEKIVNTVDYIINLLSGKKTYIVGVASIIIGFVYSDKELVMIGLSAITLRAGIKK